MDANKGQESENMASLCQVQVLAHSTMAPTLGGRFVSEPIFTDKESEVQRALSQILLVP